MSNVQGEPGEVLYATELLPAGTVADVELFPEPPLRVSGLVFLVAWVDRDEDGLFDPDLDDIAVRTDGTLAAAGAIVTVVPVEPVVITVEDQSGDGSEVTIAAIELPGPGFIEVLADAGGAPGDRLAVSGARVPGLAEEITIELEDGLDGADGDEITLWIRTIIDFDEDGTPTDTDPFGLEERDGAVATSSFTYTIDG
jgi:hypothetical protein